MAARPRGFVEHRHLAGAFSPKTQTYRVKANGVSGSHQKYPGDPVVLVSGDTVARLAAAATAASLPVLGVVRAVLNSNKRPLTFNQPSVGGPYLPASTAGYVQVNIDPLQTYLVNTDATVVSTLVGQYVDVTANTPNTAAGRSGFVIEVATGANTAANTVPFQVVGVGFNNLTLADGSGIVGGVEAPGAIDVEVKIANHVFAPLNPSLKVR